MMGWIRTDINGIWDDNYYLIPTISINTFTKGFEISFHFLGLLVFASIKYIRNEDYEP